MKILHRYIWSEFFQQFLVCWVGFTVLGIGKIFFDYNEMFIGYRVTTQVLVQLLLDQIPYLWMDVFPAATLFGLILALGRLIRERELDVIQISGLGFFRTMFPVFAGVLILCIGAFWWNDLVVPAANHHFEEEVRRLSNQNDLPFIRENVVFKAPQNRFIYINRVDHRQGKVLGIMIIESKGTGQWPSVITANWGQVRRGVWELNDGVVHHMDSKGAISAELAFKKMQLKMTGDFSTIIGEEKKPSEMRASELKKLAETYINNPEYSVYYYSKFADPLSPLVFTLLAIPLTILTKRNAHWWLGMLICFLIILGYYAIQVVGRTLGIQGFIFAWVAAWAPNITFLTSGVILLAVCEKRR